MSDKKQMIDLRAVKSISAAESDEHQRNWNDDLFERKTKNPDHNYDRSRVGLNFQIGRGGLIEPVDKSCRINDRISGIIKTRLNEKARVTKASNRGVQIIFGGNRDRMREMAFGDQILNENAETNGHIIRQQEIEKWAKDVYGFVCREFGEDNIASFIVHLDEKNPHAHCVFVPITADGRLCAKDVIGGKTKAGAQKRLRELHSRFAEVSCKYGLDREDDIHQTGARHRSTDEYNRDLHRENALLESLIGDSREELRQLRKQLKKAERRVKGLSTMIANLEDQRTKLEEEIASLNEEIRSGSGDAAELLSRIDGLEHKLSMTEALLSDKREKLRTADGQQKQLHEEEVRLKDSTEHLRQENREAAIDKQTNVRVRLTDSVYGKLAVGLKDMLPYLPEEVKEKWPLLVELAERSSEILICAMYLFCGYIDGAIQFSQSCGGGGTSDSDLPWGGKENEDDRHFAYRCMVHAANMTRQSNKRGIGR